MVSLSRDRLCCTYYLWYVTGAQLGMDSADADRHIAPDEGKEQETPPVAQYSPQLFGFAFI